jgi:isoquinoline 1-oxidoreductase alpha subunit
MPPSRRPFSNEELFMSITLNINGTRREFDGDPETPLLWVIREDVGLTGTI